MIRHASSSVTLADLSPSFELIDATHVLGIILRSDGSGAYGGGTCDILGPTGNSLGYPTVAAKAGDNIALFGVGFGPTSPSLPAGQAFLGSLPTANPILLEVGGSPAVVITPSFSGITSAGLYQINLTVPSNLGAGDLAFAAVVGNSMTQAWVIIPVQ